MLKIFKPINDVNGFKDLLADPEKHWRTGYSAKTLAYSWTETNSFPKEISEVFSKSNITAIKDLQPLFAFPEYKVDLPGGSRPSQTDLYVLARNDIGFMPIMIEGKVDEDFGPLVKEWFNTSKKPRFDFITNTLGLSGQKLDVIRYQLLHRTVSALLEAQRIGAKQAMMLVHSFSQANKHIEDYEGFTRLFGLAANVDSIVGPYKIGGIELYFGWVKGDPSYLSK